MDNPITLITDENFSTWAAHLDDQKDAHLRFWQVVADTLAQLGADSVCVVVYLRRQDEWVASSWKHNVRVGLTSEPAHEWASGSMRQIKMDYASMLKAIEDAFGNVGTILVRRYDRNNFTDGDIFHDFCEAAGIPWDEGYQVPVGDRNISLSLDVVEALRHFKASAKPTTQLRKTLFLRAHELSREDPDPPGMSFLTPEETRTFIEPFLEGNRWIEEHFLDGEQLFSDEYEHPTWIPNEDRIKAYKREFRRLIPFYPMKSLIQHGKSCIKKAIRK